MKWNSFSIHFKNAFVLSLLLVMGNILNCNSFQTGASILHAPHHHVPAWSWTKATGRKIKRVSIPGYLQVSAECNNEMPDPWASSDIDYSAVNEYVKAHYPDIALPPDSQTYFRYGKSFNEPIFDARAHCKSNSLQEKRDLLTKYGMVLMDSPTDVKDWGDTEHIRDVYLMELEQILSDLFPTKMAHCFWNPMQRGEDLEISERKYGAAPTASVASMVHIDTDVGAYDSIDDFLTLIEKNKIQGTAFDKEAFSIAISQRRRFAVINFWRNTKDQPVVSAPLGILSTRYSTTNSAFPEFPPDLEESKWFAFSNVTSKEVIAFYQYDRLVTQPSDLWHCALSIDNRFDKNIFKRESFDIRALVVLNDEVPSELDRFDSTRMRPSLTFEQSGCFCEEQTLKRRTSM
mmetsp:Transcript_15119/g.22660  ORF Transcript_15119/g.22660 Transcript_15119/m.22660 type:complete len:403 (+) Transcript_15119:207-1415(+)